MLRAFFIYLSKARWAQNLITRLGFARRAARRFVAGETLEEAIAAVAALNREGIQATLDHLGENTTSTEDALRAGREVIELIEAINRSGVQANVSIKLSQLGLTLNYDLCRDLFIKILESARKSGNFVRVDMEDSSLTQKTIDLVLGASRSGFTNTGIVIQAYLRRSREDVRLLASNQIPVRLCKGAYKEPAHLAYEHMDEVNRSYDALAESLLAVGKRWKQRPEDPRWPAFAAYATHDDKRIAHIRRLAAALKAKPQWYEFQMLYGIRRDLQKDLAVSGYGVRVYVPYGTHWYPYFMRRLAERPANLWFFVKNFFRS